MYSIQTQAKINFMTARIIEHPDWGSSRLQKSIKEEFGSQLKKDYLLKESASFRSGQKIEAPSIAYRDYAHLRAVLRKGGYTPTERDGFIRQVAKYDKDGRHNFVYSQTLSAASKQHGDWLKTLVAEARKSTQNLTQAKALVLERLEQLARKGEYDPFTMMKEVYRPRPVRRDYDDTRRQQAINRRERVSRKILR